MSLHSQKKNFHAPCPYRPFVVPLPHLKYAPKTGDKDTRSLGLECLPRTTEQGKHASSPFCQAVTSWQDLALHAGPLPTFQAPGLQPTPLLFSAPSLTNRYTPFSSPAMRTPCPAFPRGIWSLKAHPLLGNPTWEKAHERPEWSGATRAGGIPRTQTLV